jgi:hypothetical protein
MTSRLSQNSVQDKHKKNSGIATNHESPTRLAARTRGRFRAEQPGSQRSIRETLGGTDQEYAEEKIGRHVRARNRPPPMVGERQSSMIFCKIESRDSVSIACPLCTVKMC